MSTDQLYAAPRQHLDQFTFDEQVAAVFPDMIQRSVPGYTAILHMLRLITTTYAQPHSQLYDLGCSLGAASLAMAQGLTQPGCRIIAVDNAAAMLARAKSALANQSVPMDFIHADVQTQPVHHASLVVLNFTLQFIPIAARTEVLRKIRQGLRPGGVLVLSEKIAGPDTAQDTELQRLHHAYKRANAYSELEISQKRTALEKVLLPETQATHVQRLQAAGFCQITQWYQQCNFVSWIAHAC